MLHRPEVIKPGTVSCGGVEFNSREKRVVFDLGRKLEDLLHALGPNAHRARLELIGRIGPHVPARVVGDPVPLLRALTLLVRNAVRAADPGEVVVGVARAGRSPSPFAENWRPESASRPCTVVGPTTLEFEVSATTREPARPERAEQDAAAARLVGMIGGTLLVRRERGRGRVWAFRIELEAVADQGTDVPAVPLALVGSSILVADDSATTRMVLEEMLSAWGVRVHVTDSGDAALEAIQQASASGHPYDALLLDARMPRTSGFGVAEYLAKNPGLSGPPLLLLPAPFRKGDESYCRRLGVVARVSKPVRRAELLQALSEALTAHAAARVAPPSSSLVRQAAL
jgi:CheY-like chemotaxis protein